MNRLWFFLSFLAVPALLAQPAGKPADAPEKDYAPYPAPAAGYVTDLAGIVPVKDREYLNSMIYRTEKKTGVEMVVVTIASIRDYPGAGGNVETFAQGLFNAWGIGNLPKNDGVLLLVAVKDRKARIELGAGYGRQKDAEAQAIMDRVIVPHFRKGKYSEGIRKGCVAIAAEFARARWRFAYELIIILAAVIGLSFLAVSLFRNGKRGWGWAVIGVIVILLILFFKILGRITREMAEARGGTGRPGGFGGGFGGGFSGGGGATGSW